MQYLLSHRDYSQGLYTAVFYHSQIIYFPNSFEVCKLLSSNKHHELFADLDSLGFSTSKLPLNSVANTYILAAFLNSCLNITFEMNETAQLHMTKGLDNNSST